VEDKSKAVLAKTIRRLMAKFVRKQSNNNNNQ
jgi:hypothetical protein